MKKGGKGQIAIEFLLLVGMGLFILLVSLIVISNIATQRTNEETAKEVYELGLRVRDEFLLAQEMEQGYTRELILPAQINGRAYTIALGNSSARNGYLMVTYETIEYYYTIPVVIGNITPGTNSIYKDQELLIIN